MQTTAAEPQTAPYGYGISSLEGGVLLHTLATQWEARYWEGNPNSLWVEHRTSRWIVSARARCRRGLDWKAAPGPGTDWRLCPACRLTDAEIMARLTRIDLPPYDVTHTAEEEPDQ